MPRRKSLPMSSEGWPPLLLAAQRGDSAALERALAAEGADPVTCKRRKATAQSRSGMELTATVDRVAEGAPLDGCAAEHSNLLD